MRSLSFSGFANSIAKSAVAVLVCVPMWAMAQASAPMFAGASVVRHGEFAKFSGVGFEPGSKVEIVLTVPRGRLPLRYSTTIANDGSLTYNIPTYVSGVHQIKVVDKGGNTLATANFTAMD
jgi:hypothetical protein